jgi:hypothetical protein
VFSVREKNQLDVYGTWAVLRGQLATDDSFQFNKVVGQLKAAVAELPEAGPEDEEVVQRLAAAAAAGAPDPVLALYDQRQLQQQQQQRGAAAAAAAAASAAAAPAAEEAEADPFGLDALLGEKEAAAAAAEAARQQAAAQQAARQQAELAAQQQQQQQLVKSATWSGAELVCQRRAALLDCLDAAKACYRHLWARTSVDLLIEHCHAVKDRWAGAKRAGGCVDGRLGAGG